MTNYLLYALGIYAVLTAVAYFDQYFWWISGEGFRVLAMAAGVGTVMLAERPGLWYLGLGVGGLVVLVQRLDDLMSTKADEALRNTSPRRRP